MDDETEQIPPRGLAALVGMTCGGNGLAAWVGMTVEGMDGIEALGDEAEQIPPRGSGAALAGMTCGRIIS